MLTAVVIGMVLAGLWFYARQGLFTGVIHSVCCLLAVLLAFALYEPLAGLAFSWAKSGLGLSLVLVFAAALFGLKVLTDEFIGGDVTFGPPIVRSVGGALAALPGMVMMAGILLISLQLSAYPAAIWDLDRLGDRPSVPARQGPGAPEPWPAGQSVALACDDFVMGVVGLASDGGLGGTPLSVVHPTLLDELHLARLGDPAAVQGFPQAGALARAEAYRTTTAVFDPPATTQASQPDRAAAQRRAGDPLFVVRVRFGKQALDEDGNLRLRPAQLRLVLHDGRVLRPIGVSNPDALPSLARLAGNARVVLSPDGQPTLEFAFPDPGPLTRGEILFLEFRHTARCTVDLPAGGLAPLTAKDLQCKALWVSTKP